jgi:formate dehydrogenase iron-sulfur subunit
VYDNPPDLTDQSWTVMRFSEVEVEAGRLEWLIRKDGCMHCGDPGCLKACPAPGAIVQYDNGIVDFHEENCIGCGYCITGCPFFAHLQNDEPTSARCSDRVRSGWNRPAERVRQAPSCSAAKDNVVLRGEKRVRDLKERGFRMRSLRPKSVGRTS